jgi:hypothetical protein
LRLKSRILGKLRRILRKSMMMSIAGKGINQIVEKNIKREARVEVAPKKEGVVDHQLVSTVITEKAKKKRRIVIVKEGAVGVMKNLKKKAPGVEKKTNIKMSQKSKKLTTKRKMTKRMKKGIMKKRIRKKGIMKKGIMKKGIMKKRIRKKRM